MSAPDTDLLQHYFEELSWLRSMGARFAGAHPDVASRLELNGNVCPDPHVERLIESFAFLTARIQSGLAADFPEIAAQLLQTLYPHYLNPIPSMTIVRFDPKRDAPATIPRNTQLFVPASEGDVIRFRTSYAVDLWPLRVEEARVIDGFDFHYPANRRRAPSVLRLSLTALGPPFEELGLDTLRLFLKNEAVVNRLYPLLLGGDRHRVAVTEAGSLKIPNDDYLEVAPVGFEQDEDVIHFPRISHPAYRLLQEYFAFEQKFHFIDIKGLRGRLRGTSADLLFLLDAEPPAHSVLHRDDFVPGCTPAVNLFNRVSEPVRVNQRTIEHRLVPDHRRKSSTTIHSIVSISGSSNAAQTSREYAPFYSFTHHMARAGQTAFWHARRDGDDVFLSFHDDDFDPAMPADEIVYAHLLCTNGHRAAELEAGAGLQTDQDLAVADITAIRKPTRLIAPPHGGELLWRLVSHLSLNYLSIGDGDSNEAALRALREILLLYCPPEAHAQRRRIEGINRVSSRKVTERVEQSWNGFARGTEISLVVDPALVDDNVFLFASVLSHFFALHASINSFSRLVVRRDDPNDTKGIQWPVMTGGKAVL